MEARPYQVEAINNTLEVFKRKDSALIVMATGLGKSYCFSEIAGHFIKKGRVMIIAHREELITQAAGHIENIIDETVDIEMAEQYASMHEVFQNKVVIASIQTLNSGRDGGRMTRFNPLDFSLVIIDECVVAGTLIDGIPIEKRNIGDRIRSHNHKLNRVEFKPITHVFKHKTDVVVEIKLNDGKKIICTPNHPFFSLTGYVSAGKLTCNDMVLTIKLKKGYTNETKNMCSLRDGIFAEKLEQHNDPTVFGEVQGGAPTGTSKNCCNELQNLQQGSHITRTTGFGQSEAGSFCLLSRVPAKKQFNYRIDNQLEVRFGKDEDKKSYVQSRNESKGVNKTENNALDSDCSWWKRKRRYCSTEIAGLCARLADGSCNKNKNGKRFWLSTLLQSGYRKLRSKNSNRSGRKQPQGIDSKSTGREENSLFKYVGVESVTFHKRGSSNKFEQLCPDGFVYNLEVADNNNYFAENTLVHNCHHSTADSYKKVTNYFKQNPNLKILGVTATPDRSDEEALGQVFQEVAFGYDIQDGISDGWLVPIVQRLVAVEGLDYSSVRTTAGELNQKDLAEILEYEETLHHIAVPTVELAGDRKTLVFTASVAQAERLTEIINRYKPDSARFVCGKTPKELRRNYFKDFAEKKFQFLVNVGVATEGFDDPGIQVVVMARPTKSRCLYTQCVGRGTRALKGVLDGLDDIDQRVEAIAASEKPMLEILDFVGNSGRHKLITTADVLGGNYPDEVIQRAKDNIIKKAKPDKMATELQAAEREIAKERARKEDAKDRVEITARAKYSTAKVNPFNIFDVTPWQEKAWHKGRLPSTKQKELLDKNGIDYSGMSFTHASQMVDTIIKRRSEGKPTYKQTKILQRYYPRAIETMSFADASKVIDAVIKNSWKKPMVSLDKILGKVKPVEQTVSAGITDADMENIW